MGKISGTTYCFGCKDYMKNFRSQEMKMINKVLREKSHCVFCRSNKSRFLKQKKITINVTCLKNTSCKQCIKTK